MRRSNTTIKGYWERRLWVLVLLLGEGCDVSSPCRETALLLMPRCMPSVVGEPEGVGGGVPASVAAMTTGLPRRSDDGADDGARSTPLFPPPPAAAPLGTTLLLLAPLRRAARPARRA